MIMKTFTKLYIALSIKENGETKIKINKVIKDGTKREFFRVEDVNGNSLSRTLIAILYDARTYANSI